MSEVGITCLWTVDPNTWPTKWCRFKAKGVRTVPARDGKPGYEASLCTRHLELFDQGYHPDDGEPADG